MPPRTMYLCNVLWPRGFPNMLGLDGGLNQTRLFRVSSSKAKLTTTIMTVGAITTIMGSCGKTRQCFSMK
eukprot:1980392-Amphidinium_carterae.1